MRARSSPSEMDRVILLQSGKRTLEPSGLSTKPVACVSTWMLRTTWFCPAAIRSICLRWRSQVWSHTSIFVSSPALRDETKTATWDPFFLLIVPRARYLPLSSTLRGQNGGIYGGVTVAKGAVSFNTVNISASIHTLSLIRQSTNHSWLNSRSVTYSSSLDMTPSTTKAFKRVVETDSIIMRGINDWQLSHSCQSKDMAMMILKPINESVDQSDLIYNNEYMNFLYVSCGMKKQL